MYPPESIPF